MVLFCKLILLARIKSQIFTNKILRAYELLTRLVPTIERDETFVSTLPQPACISLESSFLSAAVSLFRRAKFSKKLDSVKDGPVLQTNSTCPDQITNFYE